jgi:tripartite-type tricarboxylate transporter receptor subunit TctC
MIRQLQGAVADTLALPAVRDRFLELGIEPVGNVPEAFHAFLSAEMAKYKDIIQKAAITAD